MGIIRPVSDHRENFARHGHSFNIFNMQDGNFFLPRPEDALRRFQALRAGLEKEGVRNIAIAVKARPNSITYVV